MQIDDERAEELREAKLKAEIDELTKQKVNLAALVMRLVNELNKYDDFEVAYKAKDYLERIGVKPKTTRAKHRSK